jgi:hypothetical protein
MAHKQVLFSVLSYCKFHKPDKNYVFLCCKFILLLSCFPTSIPLLTLKCWSLIITFSHKLLRDASIERRIWATLISSIVTVCQSPFRIKYLSRSFKIMHPFETVTAESTHRTYLFVFQCMQLHLVWLEGWHQGH